MLLFRKLLYSYKFVTVIYCTTLFGKNQILITTILHKSKGVVLANIHNILCLVCNRYNL